MLMSVGLNPFLISFLNSRSSDEAGTQQFTSFMSECEISGTFCPAIAGHWRVRMYGICVITAYLPNFLSGLQFKGKGENSGKVTIHVSDHVGSEQEQLTTESRKGWRLTFGGGRTLPSGRLGALFSQGERQPLFSTPRSLNDDLGPGLPWAVRSRSPSEVPHPVDRCPLPPHPSCSSSC